MLARSAVAQTRGYRPLVPLGEDRFVYERDADDDHSVVALSRSPIDGYNVRLFDPIANGTSVAAALVGVGGLVLVLDPPRWESWLREVGGVVSRRRSRMRTAVGAQIGEIQQLTRLTDSQFAAAFPGGLTRETVNRWRNNADVSVRPENAYRIGVLLELSRRMEETGIDASVWLHQALPGVDATPFELLCAGRLADVRQVVENIAAGAQPRDMAHVVSEVRREHDTVVEDAGADETWTWGEWGEDGGA
jgi:hypothetical protein